MTMYRVNHFVDIEAHDSRDAAEIYWRRVLGFTDKPSEDDRCVVFVKPLPRDARSLPATARKGALIDLAQDPDSEIEIIDLAERLRGQRVVPETSTQLAEDAADTAADRIGAALKAKARSKAKKDRAAEITLIVELVTAVTKAVAADPDTDLDQVVADHSDPEALARLLELTDPQDHDA